ncbi:MAG: glycoside hydrolase family 127 protein, partial [Bryobacteraceae bacterium]
VMERTLYNGLISGVSLDGKLFFYPNPLASTGDYERSPWFGVACCPGNITRFIASVPGYMYARRGDALYINLFAASSAHIDMSPTLAVKMIQETRYPWDGAVRVTVEPAKASAFTINVRVPGWARGEILPSALYRFAETSSQPVTLKVNGRPVPVRLEKGYVSLRRKWRKGDTIELDLPMQPRRVLASTEVAADRELIAIQRGPIVYCAEWPDNSPGHVLELALPDDFALTAEFMPDLLHGVTVVKGRRLHTTEAVEFTAIPYYAWAHRGKGEMAVWLKKPAATNS